MRKCWQKEPCSKRSKEACFTSSEDSTRREISSSRKRDTLPDGMRLHVVLCNTANAISLQELLSARHGADRVEVHVSGARGDQSNYSVTLGLREQELDDYTELSRINKLRVFKSGVSNKKYAAYKDGIEVPFDKNLQRGVYKQAAEIFQKARIAFR